MSATAAQVKKLQRAVDEPAAGVYAYDELKEILEEFPLIDKEGTEPHLQTPATATTPPVYADNPYWIPTYDIHAAAASIFEEKAAKTAQDFEFSADGGSYKRNQVYDQYMQLVRFHQARRSPRTITLHEVSTNERVLGFNNQSNSEAV